MFVENGRTEDDRANVRIGNQFVFRRSREPRREFGSPRPRFIIRMNDETTTLCLLNYEYPPIGAGAASATQAMANSLTRQGHRVVVVTAGIGDLVGERMEAGVRTIRLHCRRQRADRASLSEMLSFVAAAWKRLPAIARSIDCDGIICFFTLPCGPAAWHTWKKTGIPYVVSLRGGDVPGLVASIDWMHRVLAPLRRAILRNAVSIVANSEGLQQLGSTTVDCRGHPKRRRHREVLPCSSNKRRRRISSAGGRAIAGTKEQRLCDASPRGCSRANTATS